MQIGENILANAMTIEERTKELVSLVRRTRTKELVNYSAGELRKLFDGGLAASPLRSPYKQIFHLLGLMLCTPAGYLQPLTEKRWEQITSLLNEITEGYVWKFFFKETEPNDEWKKIRQVSMPVFLHYFNTLPLFYREQLIERIEAWYVPFDDAFAERAGISVSKCLQIIYWIENHLEASWDTLFTLAGRAENERARFVKEMGKECLTVNEARKRARNNPIAGAFRKLIDGMNELLVVNTDAFRGAFDAESADRFLSLFASRRGQVDSYFYPTEENPAELRPLFFAEDDSLMCPAPRVLLLALHRQAEKILKASAKGPVYYKHRDRQLESKAASVLKSFLPSDTPIYQNACESQVGDFEHDIVAVLDGTVLVVECKATQQREPFRDPEKAYVRIRHEFRSDAGIQKAYEQAEHLRRRLACETKVVLYDKQGNVATTIRGPVKEAFSICITLDSFGIVATNLSLLLEKSPNDPYPWAVSIFDLETILSGFAYEKKDVDDFLLFLRQRATLHGRMIATDELEIAGAFLTCGSFDRYLKVEGAIFVLTPDMSDIFDDIYYERLGIARPRPDRREPVILDAREEFRKMLTETEKDAPIHMLRKTAQKVGRNDPCPCGSGRKYKKCHGVQG